MPARKPQTRYSVVGLGKLGASMAAAIASRGYQAVGVDVDAVRVAAVNAGQAPVTETGLADAIAKNRIRLQATCDYAQAVMQSDVTFVVVPTPTDNTGMFSLAYVRRAFQELGRALTRKQKYHLIVLTSTVVPGSTRQVLLPELEKSSGKKCGSDFGLCYSPEFIALGSVMRDFLSPDFTLVGEFDDRSGQILEDCYRTILENQAPCKRMSLENAELAKLAVNNFVTMKITFANLLAELCEVIPGGDVDLICDALGADRRIGSHYLRGGLGFGGPCFPRDNIALDALSRQLDVNSEIAMVISRNNCLPVQRLVRHIRNTVPRGSTVALLGLAYKPNSDVVEESQGLKAASAISELGMKVLCYDPLARDVARSKIKFKALVLESLDACLRQADAVVLATPDPEFARLTPASFPHRDPPIQVIDCWRLLRKQLENAPGITYRGIGLSMNRSDTFAELWEDADTEPQATSS
jgi:UDPglucose 6-dehydrogenase